MYWAWDPRLTTMAILLVAYAGYLALRRFVDDPDRRAVWSAVVGIIIAVDVPVVYFSVKWWKSLHQVQSNPKTVDPQMVLALRWNAFAFLAVLIVFLVVRYRIALAGRMRETTVPEALERRPAGGGLMSTVNTGPRRGRRGKNPRAAGSMSGPAYGIAWTGLRCTRCPLGPLAEGGDEVNSHQPQPPDRRRGAAGRRRRPGLRRLREHRENLVFYWTPGEMLAQGSKAYGPTIRLGGVVQPGSLNWDAARTTSLPGRGQRQARRALGPGGLARDAAADVPRRIGVVVEGTFDKSQTFTSSRLMVNHSNEYRPPKPGDGPDKWKTTVSAPTAEAR